MKQKVIILSLVFSALLFGFASLSYASSDIGLKAIGPRLGFIDPEGAFDGGLNFGVDFGLGTFVDQLYWDASVEFWRKNTVPKWF